MIKSLKRVTSWLFMSIIVFMASCSKDSGPQTASLQVRLTDAPGDYQEVNVDIQDVQVSSADPNGAESGWVSLNVNKGVYNLLDFTNGLDTLLGSAVLPVGKITQIRLVLGSNNTVKVDSQTFSLTTPSAQQSGLKVLVNTTLTAGATYKITLDFDAARSIVLTGSSKYILKPVIHSVVTALTGSIQGVVDPAASTPAIYAIQGTDTIESASADATTGKFMLKGLAAGSYNVSFAPKTGYVTKTVNGVAVTVGNITSMDTVKISAQ